MSALTKTLRIVIAVLVVIVVAGLIWLLFIKKDDNSSTSSAPPVHKTVAKYSAAELPGAVSSAENPVYWLGPKPGDEYELTLISDGRAYIRYLPRGVPAESGETYLTVGSYAFQDPTAELKKLGQNPGSHTFTVPGGGLGMATESASQHVYVAYPDENVEIEVFDPHTGSAEQAAKSGELTPIR
jgi:hypothetical protein